MIHYTFLARTDPGRARDNNEDAVLVDETASLGVLADGMGGYNAGEIASGMATAFIKSEMSRWLAEAGKNAKLKEIKRALEICVDNANRSIFNASGSNPQYSGMGTTLVVGVFHDTTLILGHIGDSRCYRLRNGTLVQITKDHSFVQNLVDGHAFAVHGERIRRAERSERLVHVHGQVPVDSDLVVGAFDHIEGAFREGGLQTQTALLRAGAQPRLVGQFRLGANALGIGAPLAAQ